MAALELDGMRRGWIAATGWPRRWRCGGMRRGWIVALPPEATVGSAAPRLARRRRGWLGAVSKSTVARQRAKRRKCEPATTRKQRYEAWLCSARRLPKRKTEPATSRSPQVLRGGDVREGQRASRPYDVYANVIREWATRGVLQQRRTRACARRGRNLELQLGSTVKGALGSDRGRCSKAY